ncbi:MAG: hypothetical protein ACRC9L_08135 [Brevinema sp.]
MKKFCLAFSVIFAIGISYAKDTLSIRGNITVRADALQLSGDLTYTIQNQSSNPKNQWVLAVNPLVDILAVRQGEADLEVRSQISGNMRILTITLPLRTNERTSVNIRFSLLPQGQDPRLIFDETGAFLDGRRQWLPLPINDKSISYNISVLTPTNLRAIMGGKLISETESLVGNISTWSSELNKIMLSSTLILTTKSRKKIGDLYFYDDDLDALTQALTPYWGAIREKQRFYPLTEAHLFPTDIRIPGKADDFADGEFIGSIIFLDSKLVRAAKNPLHSFTLSGPAHKRLLETVIHELFHAYLPGVLEYSPKESILMESFVQYLTLSLISSISPSWGAEIRRRDRFLMLNLLTSRDTQNPIWKYLLGSTLFDKTFEQSMLRGILLADTLSEKYQDTDFAFTDIIETANIHQNLALSDDKIFPEFLNEFNRTFLYNTDLQRISTNLTNAFDSSYEQLTLLRIRHTYPKEWLGSLVWVDQDGTNTLPLTLPAGTIWVSNFSSSQISYAMLKSHLDDLEQFLGDNLTPEANIGWQLIQHLNNADFFDEEYRKNQRILVKPELLKRLETYRSLGFSYLWDNTKDRELQAYLVDIRNLRQAFITLSFSQVNDSVEILELFNPLEQRILSQRRQSLENSSSP